MDDDDDWLFDWLFVWLVGWLVCSVCLFSWFVCLVGFSYKSYWCSPLIDLPAQIPNPLMDDDNGEVDMLTQCKTNLV